MKNLKKQIQLAVDTYKSRDFVKAETLCKDLIKDNPKVVFLYNLLGLISVEQGKIDEALNYYKKGIHLDPSFAIIYNNLGLLFINHKSDIEKAENFYKKCISIDSNISEAQNNLGSLYNTIGKFEDSITCYKKAISINPKFSQAYHNLANVYIAIGNFDLAKKNLLEAIKINPQYSNSHRTLSRLINYSDANKHLDELKKLYEKINIDDSENKTNIAFALGKAYEDIKDYDKSFSFYKIANETYRKRINFSLNDEKIKFKEIKEIFDKKLFEKYAGCGSDDTSPIFIVGMPRSGTTLVEQILSSHPKVFGADEIEYIPQLVKKHFGRKNISLYLNQIVNFEDSNLKKIGMEYISKIKKISNNSERVTDKLPKNFLSIGFIRLVLPKAKIVHCQRNFKDNCISIYKNHFPGGKINFAYDLNEINEYYKLYKDLMDHWNNIFDKYIFNIKYENLISNTKNEVENLIKFCDLEWHDSCLNFHFNRRAIRTASDIQARKKIYKSSINNWKKYENHLSKYF